MFGLLSADSQEVIERNEVIRRVREWNPGFDPECLSTLFEVRGKDIYPPIVKILNLHVELLLLQCKIHFEV